MIERNNNFNDQLNSLSNLSNDWGTIGKLEVGQRLYSADKTLSVYYDKMAYLSSFIWNPSVELYGSEIDSFQLFHDKVIQTLDTIGTIDAGVHDSSLKATDAFAAFKGLENLEKNIAEANDGLTNFIKTHEGKTYNLTSKAEGDKVDEFLMDVKEMVGGQILDKIANIKEFISSDERIKPMLVAQQIYAEESTNGAFQTLQLDDNMKEALDLSFFINPSVEENALAMGEKFPFESPKEIIGEIFRGIGADVSLEKVKNSDLQLPDQFLKDFFRISFLNLNNEEINATNPDVENSEEQKVSILKNFISKCSEGLSKEEGLLFTQNLGRLMPQEVVADLFGKLFYSLFDPETEESPLFRNLKMKMDITVDEKTVSIDIKKGIAVLDEYEEERDYYVIRRKMTMAKDEILNEDFSLPSIKVQDSVSHALTSPISYELLFFNL